MADKSERRVDDLMVDANILTHPLLEIVANLSRLQLDALTIDQTILLHHDVHKLQCAASGPFLTEPHKDHRLLAEIREKLDAAERAARLVSRPLSKAMESKSPSGPTVEMLISDLRLKLENKINIGEMIAEAGMIDIPEDRRKRRNYAAYQVALVAARVFEERVGRATIKKHSDKSPVSAFGRFIEDVFRALFPSSRGGCPEWYGPWILA